MNSQCKDIAIYHYCNEIHRSISNLNNNITNFISYDVFQLEDNVVREFIDATGY